MLTLEQRQIVESPSQRVVVQAQPGSGKTRVLVERFLRFLKSGTYRADQLVAITFTQKAAEEMKNRIRLSLSESNGVDLFWISTIHGFCSRILNEQVWETGLPPQFRVLSNEEALYLKDKSIRQVLTEGGDASSLQELFWVYGYERLKGILVQFLNDRYRFKEALEIPADPASAPLLKHLEKIGGQVLETYQGIKLTQGGVDFDDLLLFTLQLFKKQPEICESYRQRFKLIMIDEFQDTDPVQFDIIKALQPGPFLMVVGDPKQSIYRFRGAQVSLFSEMKAQHEMSTNFRSTPSLVHFVNTLFEPLLKPYFLRSKPALEQLGNPLVGKGIEYWHPQSSQEGWNAQGGRLKEAHWLAAHLKKLHKTSWREIAILFRAMTYAEFYEQALSEVGIPWIRSDGGFFYESREVEELLAILKWVLDPTDDFSLWLTLSAPWMGLSSKELLALAKFKVEKRCSLYEALERGDEIEGRLKEALFFLQKMIWWKERLSLEAWYHKLSLSFTTAEKKFLHVVRAFEVREEDPSWQEFLTYMEALKAASVKATELCENQDVDAVRLLTVHQSKGLEFDVVYLADLGYLPRAHTTDLFVDTQLGVGLKIPGDKPNEWKEDAIYKQIKSKEKEADSEESKRLFYVAMTRAKFHLVLSTMTLKPRKGSWASLLEEERPRLSSLWKEGILS